MVTFATAHGLIAFTSLDSTNTLSNESSCAAITTKDSLYLSREKSAPGYRLPAYSASGSGPSSFGQLGNSVGVFHLR